MNAFTAVDPIVGAREYADDFPAMLSEVVNPVTRSTIRLMPPVRIDSSEQFWQFCGHFRHWCQAEFNSEPHRDPIVLDVPDAWLAFT